MYSYVLGLLGILVLFYNPISELISPGAPKIVRTGRPQLNQDLLALESSAQNASDCPSDAYSVHIFSKAPLVLYVENFLSEEERRHLLEISEPIFEPSTVTHDGGDSTQQDATVRDSEVALIPRTSTVRCIENRARALQGWRDEVWVERLRVQRYRLGGHYSHHFDWSSSRGGWGRVSSFMVWVADDEGGLVGGGTEFPLLDRWTTDERWCKFVECGETGQGDSAQKEKQSQSPPRRPGTVFKAVAGNAVFWENFRPDSTGRGYDETWHAGLPVERGTKVGLNIWSWGRLD